MRVIAGSARRLVLKTVEGKDTRPTTDRIKETLFNMLQPYLIQCRFLDLFAGSGAIGIEALSRGSEYAVFIEQNPQAVRCIQDNLITTGLKEGATVMTCDVISGLRQLEDRQETFDLIFMDPPYNQSLEQRVLEFLKTSMLVSEDTLIIVEASLDTDFSYLESLGYTMIKNKTYKTNKHLFLKREGE